MTRRDNLIRRLNLLCGTLETDTGGRVWNGEAWAPLDFKTNPVTRVDDVTDESEIDAIRMKRALTRIWQSPGTWLMVRAKQYPKLFIDNGDYLLGSANLPLREAFSQARWSVIFIKLAFIGGNLSIILLAVIGMWVLGPRLGDYGHIVLFPIFGMLVHLPMWIEPRYFVPMMPMIFILVMKFSGSFVSTYLVSSPIRVSTCIIIHLLLPTVKG